MSELKYKGNRENIKIIYDRKASDVDRAETIAKVCRFETTADFEEAVECKSINVQEAKCDEKLKGNTECFDDAKRKRKHTSGDGKGNDKDETPVGSGTYLKLICVRSTNNPCKSLELDVIKENEDGDFIFLPESQTIIKNKLKEKFQTDIKTWTKHSGIIDGIMDGLSEYFNTFDHLDKKENTERVKKHDSESTLSQCEALLKMYVNKTTVITFPFRSLAPIQWTKSKRLKHKLRNKNTEDTHENEEIVAWYLKKVNDGEISDAERKKEEKYFELITNNTHYDFTYDQFEKKISPHPGEPCRVLPFILKIPEGIYEAKALSILLAVDRFNTVCLEIPERGMHSQMVDRLRDLVLQQIKNKVILIVSHHPGFVSHLTLERVFLFERKAGYASEIKTMKKASNKEEGVEQYDKTARILTVGHIPSLFFAERLLFVEGEGDYYFVFSLRYLLFTEESLFLPFLEKLEAKEQGPGRSKTIEDEVRRFFLSLQILTLDGEANKFRYRRFCEQLGKPNMFLMDKDALFNNIPGASQKDPAKCIKIFLEIFGLNYDDETRQTIMENVPILERDGIFLWKAGTIEDALSALCEKKPALKRILKEENVHWQRTNPRSSQSNESNERLRDTETRPGTKVLDVDACSGQKAKKKKKKPAKDKKIFSDDKLTNDNIYKAVKAIIKESQDDTESEFHRLIMFLLGQSGRC